MGYLSTNQQLVSFLAGFLVAINSMCQDRSTPFVGYKLISPLTGMHKPLLLALWNFMTIPYYMEIMVV